VSKRSAEDLAVFESAVRSRLNVEPSQDGEIAIARHLGERPTDEWINVWTAYSDAPDRYPNVEQRLEDAKPKTTKEAKTPYAATLFDRRDAWPQDNKALEAMLRSELAALDGVSAEDARTKLLALESEHGVRRTWVWARRRYSPLAFASEFLATLARVTRTAVPTGTVSDITAWYARDGWKADDAVMRSLGAVETPDDVQAVGVAVASVYREWLEIGAERLQTAATATGAGYHVEPLDHWPVGCAVIFTDGLRYDVGERLGERLRSAGVNVDIEPRLTTIPTITPSGKPGASPAFRAFVPGPDLGPIAAPGAPPLSADALRKSIATAGYQILAGGELGDPTGRAWAEQGDIDKLGHDETNLAPLLDLEVQKLAIRIGALLAAGWKQVAVVTDHGWLYLPGGLPKAELVIGKVQDGKRKGRAARLADGVSVDVPVMPWTWDSSVRIAVGPGIRVFSGNPVYEHGGVSPQECITPIVVARAGQSSSGPIEIEPTWSGLRVRMAIVGAPADATVDLRRKAGDPVTTVV
jgi:hypothetical protein